MKIIFIFCLIVCSVLSFKIEEENDLQNLQFESSQSTLPSTLGSCTSAQINQGYSSITYCQVKSIGDSALCIEDFIKNKTGQQWDIFIRQDNSTDAVAIWYFDGCYLDLNKYGKYYRTYTLWPSKAYSSITKSNQDDQSQSKDSSKKQQQKQKSSRKSLSEVVKIKSLKQKNIVLSDSILEDNFQKSEESQKHERLQRNEDTFKNVGGACASYRTAAVNDALLNCDIAGNDKAASCIVNRLKDHLNEYWNAYVGSDSAVQGWYYDNCGFDIQNYGIYKREILVWKAYA